MKTKTLISSLILAIAVAAVWLANTNPVLAADPPGILNHQGRISVGGVNYAGPNGFFKFAMTDSAGTTVYWTNDGSAGPLPTNGVQVAVANGHYAVGLGDASLTNMTAVPASVFTDNAEVYLRVWFSQTLMGTYEELTPKRRMASAAYALSANKAQNVMTGSVSDLTFLGTTTATPFALSVNNTAGLRLEYPTSGSVPNLIGGWSGNSISAGSQGSVIAGGGSSASPNAVTGGASDASIGGGRANTVSGNGATVGGGFGNTASGAASMVGGGQSNMASGLSAAVGGGQNNTASGATATVGGGQQNTASGDWSTVPGGRSNEASGFYSFASGRLAKANHLGAFVWADSDGGSSLGAEFASTANDQFLIRAAGGVGIGTPSPASPLHVKKDTGGATAIFETEGTGSPVNAIEFRSNKGGANFGTDLLFIDEGIQDARISSTANGGLWLGTNGNSDQLVIDSAGEVGIGTTSPNSRLHVDGNGTDPSLRVQVSGSTKLVVDSNGGTAIGVFGVTPPADGLYVQGDAGNATGVWSNLSDRRIKENIAPLEPGSLDRLLRLRGVSYDYTRQHLREAYPHTHRGWVAQEVEKVFPEWVSEAPDGMKKLTPVGINALTVEALRELREEKDAAIAALEEENAALRERLERLEKAVGRLTTNGHE